jgi:glycosyltransferase involved in cell wall biosynthesis
MASPEGESAPPAPVQERSNPVKVAILIPSTSGGGAEFVAMQWAAQLTRWNYEIVVLVTHPRSDREIADVEGQPQVLQVKGATAFAQVLKLRSYLRDARPDVILSLMPHWNLMALIATRALKARPNVYISGRNIETALRKVQGPRYALEIALARHMYKRADAYIAISHPTAAEAVGAYGIELPRVFVVPNPATAKSQPSHRTRRASPRVERGVPLTLTVPARLVDQKRPRLAIDTARVLREHYGIPTTVEFFGSGPLEEDVRQYARTRGIPVSIRGWVDAWYESAAENAVVLLPSLVEGFGNVLVEAAVVGIRVVVPSRALGVADALIPGMTGVLAVEETPQALADAVMEAGTIPQADYSGWLARFSVENSSRKLEAAILAGRS